MKKKQNLKNRTAAHCLLIGFGMLGMGFWTLTLSNCYYEKNKQNQTNRTAAYYLLILECWESALDLTKMFFES